MKQLFIKWLKEEGLYSRVALDLDKSNVPEDHEDFWVFGPKSLINWKEREEGIDFWDEKYEKWLVYQAPITRYNPFYIIILESLLKFFNFNTTSFLYLEFIQKTKPHSLIKSIQVLLDLTKLNCENASVLASVTTRILDTLPLVLIAGKPISNELRDLISSKWSDHIKPIQKGIIEVAFANLDKTSVFS